MPADIIKDHLGEDGTVEMEMLKVGIPAVTMELGSAKEWNRDINTMRGVQQGIKNAMSHLGMWEGGIDMLGIETYSCNSFTNIRANRGGYTETLVELEHDVSVGDVVGYMYDACIWRSS
ncbi:succinylglutamate desuccinylase aspartoacylase [Seminavis robusta]|uniref:Succinylglutamate desuccinylase aspartoacylase n=1 Tax=Seminavis robusta TaxID=568900 RepID=A0A9N8ELW8_9STRA|nr:succinylglutamate desuccinylase aspartoacylase [Seminavis robusta]|eukprot:Sro1186_g250270.1 succinylglutamate desuccinylase aspartoacylase (119) ;mRNA; r:12142-12498